MGFADKKFVSRRIRFYWYFVTILRKGGGDMTISQFKGRTHIAVIGLASVYLGSCGLSTKSSISLKKSIQPSSTMTAISPPVAKASEAITVTGTNFSSNGAYIARFTLADGSIKDVPVSVIDSTKASFLMPEGLGLGEKSVEMVKLAGC